MDECDALMAMMHECPSCGGLHFIEVFPLDETIEIEGFMYDLVGACPITGDDILMSIEEDEEDLYAA